MKKTLLIYANNNTWSSWEDKKEQIKKFWKPVCDLDITVVNTSFKNIPFEYVMVSDGSTGKEMFVTSGVVQNKWFDENVSFKAKGYDFVALVLNQLDKGNYKTASGVQTLLDSSVVEITIFANGEFDGAYAQGFKYLGNSFVLYLCHEMSHGFYRLFDKKDYTHTHFYSGYPERVLLDFQGIPQKALVRDLMNKIYAFYQKYLAKANTQLPSGKKMYDTAYANLGRDLSPKENELACAETVNALAKMAWGEEVGGLLSTKSMYESLIRDIKYMEIVKPLPGDIIISPTGYGNGKIPNGHVGIVGKNWIMSNQSSTSKLEANFTIESWRNYFEKKGGYPVVFFRRIII